MVVPPVAKAVAVPWALMVAKAGEDEVQTTELVMSCVLASENVPVAVNCFVVCGAMLEFAGVTAMETTVAPVTVNEAVPLTEPDVAVMVTVPVATPVTRPVVSTPATEVVEDDHVTDGKSWVLPSSKLPVAVKSWVVPAAIDATDGVTEIDVRCAATTVKVDVSLKPLMLALIVTWPAATVLTRPEVLMVAIVVSEEFHVTPLLRSALDPSL
jgi:hypothetical protein